MKNIKNKLFLFMLFGIMIGFVNGFLGGGGGIIAVILLLAVGGMNQNSAQATALAIILPTSVLSSVIYLLNGSVDWIKIIFTTIGVILGGLLGAILLKKLNSNVTKFIFSLILIMAGVKMFL